MYVADNELGGPCLCKSPDGTARGELADVDGLLKCRASKTKTKQDGSVQLTRAYV